MFISNQLCSRNFTEGLQDEFQQNRIKNNSSDTKLLIGTHVGPPRKGCARKNAGIADLQGGTSFPFGISRVCAHLFFLRMKRVPSLKLSSRTRLQHPPIYSCGC